MWVVVRKMLRVFDTFIIIFFCYGLIYYIIDRSDN